MIDQDTLDAYRRGAESGVMKNATPYVVKQLLNEIGRLQAFIDKLQKLEGTDAPEHRCDRCGGRNITSWYADSDVWNRAAGDYSILCPICFSELAAEVGMTPTTWRLSIEGDDPEISKLRTRLHARLKEAADLHVEVERLDNARMAAMHACRNATPGEWRDKAIEILEAAEAASVQPRPLAPMNHPRPN